MDTSCMARRCEMICQIVAFIDKELILYVSVSLGDPDHRRCCCDSEATGSTPSRSKSYHGHGTVLYTSAPGPDTQTMALGFRLANVLQ